MKFVLKISVLLMIVLFLVVCKKEQNEEVMPQRIELDKKTEYEIKKNNYLSIKLFKTEFFSNYKDENILVSSLSFSNPLQILKKSIKKDVLNFDFESKYQENSSEIPFYSTPSKSSFVKMISSKYYFNFYSDKNIEFVEIPLKRTNYNMYVIVPTENETTSGIINKLSYSFFNKISLKARKNKMQVFLPQFNVNYTAKSVKVNKLKSIKLNFKSNNNVKNSFFSNEDENSYKTFFVNRPFIFIISEKSTNTILFVGKVNQP